MKKWMAPISLGSFSTPGLRGQNQDGFPSAPSRWPPSCSRCPKGPQHPSPFALWVLRVCGARRQLCVPSQSRSRGLEQMCPVTVRTWSPKGSDKGGRRDSRTARRGSAETGNRMPPATAEATVASVRSSCAEKGSRRGNPARSNAWSTAGRGKAVRCIP